ncbi:MAG TPA: TIGR00730 family Rossman fold protein [Lentisphaeria bacterium]|nr:MAG: Rossman fold protein, TIGR00730 family [Lentisphaerae bacterium GWF2_38_69]HBM14892.1 TIGR00730 family Rossman fold protein [Lentisphaeria bacterium]
MLKSICVFCGSDFGSRDEYSEAAAELGKAIAKKSLKLIYGGAKIGLMGIVAKSCMENGGHVIGIMPQHLANLEIVYDDVTDMRIVDSMHERKALMENLSDAFIAMPGGMGTLEEIFEILTWAKLQLHNKPCGFLNILGYYDKLFEFLSHAQSERFIKDDFNSLFKIDSGIESLLAKLGI